MLKVSNFFDDLKLRRDSQIADFGCGLGVNSKILSELIPDGKVYAIDVNKEKLEYLDEEILKEKKKSLYQNIIPVWGDIETLDGTRLRDDTMDCILISNTFFLLRHKKTCIMEMKRVLKKYGKILFIDWHKHLGQSFMHKSLVLRESEIEQLFSEAGLSVYPRIYKDDHHFVLIIEKR